MLRARTNIFELQPLEARRFPTTATVDSTNTLQILGTTSADDITLNRNSSNRLTVSGVTSTFAIGSAAGEVNKINIQASGGDDTILLTNNVRFPSNNAGIPATVAGNAGNDTMTSGPGNDVLSGNDGNDLMDGGVGDDLMTGGAGLDTSNYSNRPTALRITINNSADADGEIGIPENDKVETEEVIGGLGNDTIIGTSLSDYIAGGAGNDSLDGMAGNDELTGNSGSDTLLGKEGDDYLQAQNQDRDTVNGGTGPNATDFDIATIDTLDVSGLAASLSASLIAGPSISASASSVSSPNDLDATYGNLGIAIGNALGWTPVAAAVDSQGRVVFVGTDYIDQGEGTPGDDFAVARFKADGTGLDPTFGVGGVRVIDFSDLGVYSTGHNEEEIAYGLAIGPGDSIFIVGQATDGVGSGEDTDFAVAKLTSSGAPDSTFGNAGRVINFLAGSDEIARDVAVQSDGKIVVVGTSSSAGGVAAVARFTAAGVLDGTFGGGDGYASVDLGGTSDSAVAIALQNLPGDLGAQRIIIGGTANGNFALARFLADGSLDATGFGVGGAEGINGVVWQDLSGGLGQSTLRDLAVDPSNNIVAAGGAGTNAVLTKFTADGTFVTSFSQSAVSGSATFGSVTVDPQGRYVGVGASGGDFLVARATSSMQADGTFAPGGAVTTNFGVGYTDSAFAVSVMADNKIVAAGSSLTPSALTLPVAARYIGGGGIVPPNSEADVTEVEKFVKNEDFQNPTPELQAILDSVSDIGKLYITSQPNSLGNGTLTLNDRDNVVRIYKVTAQNGEENIAVEVDRVVFYYESDSTHFLSISTGGGNDIVTVAADITFPISVDGGTGNDAISLGSGDDVAFGGSGNDVLIGMAGHDQLDGGGGEDIVIGGISIANGDLTALKNIQSEWSLATNQSSRVSHLTNPGNGGKNDPNKLIAGSTILDDGAADYLTGGDGNDWLFARSTGTNADVIFGPAERISFV
jgi:uncharacterized delta-60 repeat protein